jgi:hypothetical protein
MVRVRFDSDTYNSSVSKLVTVMCNDPSQPATLLELTGTVSKVFDIIPSVAKLNLEPETPIGSATLRITNYLDQPLFLFAPASTNRLFGAELKTNCLGKEYLLVVSNTTALPVGLVLANITLATSLTNLPVMSLRAMAITRPLIDLFPPRITLPAPPMPTNKLVQYVTVANNSTNPLTLSDAAVSSNEAHVSAYAADPGRRYTFALRFPPDFHLAGGQAVFFTAKTSNPEFPEIKVPISQDTLPAMHIQGAPNSSTPRTETTLPRSVPSLSRD